LHVNVCKGGEILNIGDVFVKGSLITCLAN